MTTVTKNKLSFKPKQEITRNKNFKTSKLFLLKILNRKSKTIIYISFSFSFYYLVIDSAIFNFNTFISKKVVAQVPKKIHFYFSNPLF